MTKVTYNDERTGIIFNIFYVNGIRKLNCSAEYGIDWGDKNFAMDINSSLKILNINFSSKLSWKGKCGYETFRLKIGIEGRHNLFVPFENEIKTITDFNLNGKISKPFELPPLTCIDFHPLNNLSELNGAIYIKCDAIIRRLAND